MMRTRLGVCDGWSMFLAAFTAVLATTLVFLVIPESADAATPVSIEAETMDSSDSSSTFSEVVSDKTASGGKVLKLFKNGTVSKQFDGDPDQLTVRAAGDRCTGAPRMVVEIDGVEQLSTYVGRGWKSYTVDVPSQSGPHTIAISFTNNRRIRHCDRSLKVDVVNSQEPVALGAYVYGAPRDPAKLDEFAQMTGKMPSIVMTWRDWANGGFDPTPLNTITSRGAMPMVSWHPNDWNKSSTDQSDYKLSKIARGDHDAYIRQYAKDAKAWGKPFYLRFAAEMNGRNNPWGTQEGNAYGNTPEDFVAAWKHVHDIFEEEGATNARWVWNPDFTYPDRPSYASLYPGDEYVDWAAIDAYNWGTSQSWSSWQTFPQTFDASYKEMDALNDKPMMLGETASSEKGGDKAAWIRRTFQEDLPGLYPQVRAVVWFNEDKETDWRVDSSSSSLEAYKEAVADSYYQGKLP